jgi:hypothetical protein
MFGGLKLYDLGTVPGPGQYNTENVGKFYDTPSTKFAHERRFSRLDRHVPGPG